MDPIWILVALAFGFVAQQLHLPPLVGFLVAGFALHMMGWEGGELIEIAADFGVLLLLFSIGLKLRLKDFAKPVIWGGAGLHMLLMVLAVNGLVLLLGYLGSRYFAALDMGAIATIAFAFSFSSTVFAIKILEERGETRTRHALFAIGILVVQDIVAVLFLLAAQGKLPSFWAATLLALPLLQPLLHKLLQRAGHGEVLILFGIAVTVAGSQLFELVGLKDGLGAIVFGALLSGHVKTTELSKSLLSLKDLFLLGFFLSIGLNGLPGMQELAIVFSSLLVLMPLKFALFFWLITRFAVRARTAFLAALALANFSEFGLIVAAEGAKLGLIGQEWVVITAIATALSFIIGSLLNLRAHEFFQRYEKFFCRFEIENCDSVTNIAGLGNADALVVGMGRVGRSAYESLMENNLLDVCGVEVDRVKVEQLREEGLKVISGDAEDIEFWRFVTQRDLKLVLLSLPEHDDMLRATRLLRQIGYTRTIGAVSRHEDERLQLVEAGADAAYNYYSEVGTGFANHVKRQLASSGQNILEGQGP